MRALATAWPGDSKVPQPVELLPWGHIRLILDKLDGASTRDRYVAAAVKSGWSRDVLLNQIKNRTLERSGSAPSNFSAELTPTDSELAKQLSKDPYVFDFLELTEDAAERDLEQALMDRIVDTLRGTGFAFVGRQVHFDVGGDDFYLDLLFFHVEQLRYMVIELKPGNFSQSTPANLVSTFHWSMTGLAESHTRPQSVSSSVATETITRSVTHMRFLLGTLSLLVDGRWCVPPLVGLDGQRAEYPPSTRW